MRPPADNPPLAAQLQLLQEENAALRAELSRHAEANVRFQQETEVLHRQLREREHDLRSILDHMPAMIGYWDTGLRNRFGNHAYVDWFGIHPEQMRGKHIREVIGEERYRLNLPYIEAALRGEPQTFERAIPSLDGQQMRHSLASYIPDIFDGTVRGFYVLVLDITPIKETQAALEASQDRLRCNEERYRAVVEDQTEIISRFRSDGSFLFVNDVYCRFFGKSRDELMGKSWAPVCHPDDVETVRQKLAALGPERPVVVIENRVYGGDGRLHWMQFVNRAFFSDNGELLEIQSVGRDISERKGVEETLQLTLADLEARVAARTESLRRLTVEAALAEERERQTIARDLHDDLGQLLHVAKIRLDALHKTLGDDRQRALAEQLDTLLGQTSTRVRSLTAQLSPPVLESLGLCRALVWLGEEMERTYGLSVEVDDDGSDKPLTSLQSSILFRAARELLINAHKHAQAPLVRVETAVVEGCLLLRVSDEGVGMADPVALLQSRQGFGLASLQERIHYLSGEMDIVSAPDKGTAVILSLPLSTAARSE